jgi:hypothetical protein
VDVAVLVAVFVAVFVGVLVKVQVFQAASKQGQVFGRISIPHP